ncbi:unnamed protein product [Durusdinium trenchii]|uniref:N-acetyltransferase domain-containing protein n=1 Tax=Durusdinium trenchii TaxID=1381693 RepID=A0ABP0MSL1_9DINO
MMPLLATGLDVCRRLSLTILQYTISVLQLAPQHNAVATFTVCGVHGLWQQVIMSRVLAECQKASLPELCWFCLSENEAAMSFYQRMGFKPTPATVWNYPGMYEAA